MKNRFYLSILLFSVSLLLSSTLVMAQQPNILWLVCEDISPTLSMYGDSTAYTPNLDKLASESLIFTNAFATVGVCAPSRSSIITGMYPTSIGTQHMRTGKDSGGWGRRDYSMPSMAVDINGDSIPLYSAVIPEQVRCFTEYLREVGYYCTNNAKTDYQFAAPITAWDANSRQAHWQNRKPGQPFFAVFNHGVTHESRMWVNKDLPLTVDPDSVPLPAYYPDNPVVRHDVARNYSNIELLDQEIGEKLKELEEAGLLENTIIFFYSDHGGPLPRGKREHYDSGLKVPFMVRIPENLRQKYTDELISFVDLAPTVLSLAGVPVPDYIQGQAFLGLEKSARDRKYIFGSGDRFDEFSDRIRIARDKQFLYVRNYHPDLPAYKDVGYRKNINMTNELIRLYKADSLNEEQSYWFRSTKTSEEFYDCLADPENLNSLIDDPKYSQQITASRTAMDEWINEVGDAGAVPEKEQFLAMWPDGIQPETAKPQVIQYEKEIQLTCDTDGASIAFIVSDEEIDPDFDAGWQLYYQPIVVGKYQKLYVQAHRIGFKESEIVVWH